MFQSAVRSFPEALRAKGYAQSFLIIGPVVVSLFFITKVVYNIFIHPLAKYPGPKLYAASPVPISLAQLRGQLHTVTKAAHDKYGPVVRMSPNELSFISDTAWQDIYARHRSTPAMARDRTFFNNMLLHPQTITMADDIDHNRIRRSLNPAFSSQALLEQEPILQQNVSLLMDKLQEHAEHGYPLDLRAWYNYTTFDLIGDLAFGETFGCLATSRFHEWAQMVLDYFFVATLLHVVHRLYPLNKLFAFLLPPSVMKKKKQHSQMAIDKVRKRTDPLNAVMRRDFIHYLLQSVDSCSITQDELESQASVLILAGSETTSIALTYATFFLTQHPEILEKLRVELQQNFKSEGDIDLLSIDRLHYLHAVLQETLRCRPPITNGFPRQVPNGGAFVDDNFLPGGVCQFLFKLRCSYI
ncbi:hypothetical protein QQS21_005119 [Conoideocrella luteorostrata]|uniref:Cytochrome P450 n=1 Tax=Conoideocrella luteorostrata TaxID=1105319 RepID=A0AAJ0CT46_9HYPO|nr:hypothetical protein QQS21_005119 [Conoideocrella luteorostrata]